MVPVMGAILHPGSLVVVVAHISSLPQVFTMIFADAFDFEAIFGGVSGSCLIYGIKRGLYSNEAGIGSLRMRQLLLTSAILSNRGWSRCCRSSSIPS